MSPGLETVTVALGATEVSRLDVGGGLRRVALAAPDGNAFCVGALRD